MKRILVGKLLMFLLCLIPAAADGPSPEKIGAMLFALCWTSLDEAVPGTLGRCMPLLYAAAALFWTEAAYFLPLFVYDGAGAWEENRRNRGSRREDGTSGSRWGDIRWDGVSAVAALLVLGFRFYPGDPMTFARLLLLGTAGFWIRRLCGSLRRLEKQYHSYRDQSAEQWNALRAKNQELISRQDYEVELATLNERTRIAREIHDNVGHLLTRSILQVSALQVICREDEDLKEPLEMLRGTLGDAMDNIRSSVHDLHDDAVNLEMSLRALLDSFSFCPVIFNYEAGKLPRAVVYCFLAVCKEALSNIARHSQATEASVSVAEHPGFYQLIIRDNGKGTAKSREAGHPEGRVSQGIGLLNMRERVEALGGNFNLQFDGGCSIFISVPRKGRGLSDAGDSDR